jgi:acyl transferase domain-containing protein/NAD(P)-dependent dehydrogenase (short-subunit alcohol dehydrogenase family)/SAM-dependent methyltransferase/acyl carrier protein
MKETIDLLRIKLEELLVTTFGAGDDEKSFVELGVDSVVATEWIEFIRRELKPDLKVSALFDYPSLKQLASFLKPRNGPDFTESIASYRSSATAFSATAYPPIAVVGMSGRFADADNIEKLWQNLVTGVCSIKPLPANRSRYWDLAELGSLFPQSAIRGGFLEDVELFDAAFFGIPAPEASVMDPQQRLFLEEAWHAIEDAGYASETLSGVRCGIYVGVMNTDYQDLLSQVNARNPKVHELTGSAPSILAARIAYHLNLRGPAVAVDTACSSSITALHFACRALQLGEIDMAVAGGVTLYLTQKRYHLMKQAGMLSPSGTCRPFDDAADGTVPGEAAAVVVLKRLEDAVRDRDSIYGTIVSSGINQDGKTNGITAPSRQAQLELLTEVYHRGNVDPATIQYIETHGTGTNLGDPIEFEALTDLLSVAGGSAFKQSSSTKSHACFFGSVKANLGHTTAAAGATGLIKILLSLRDRAIPPQIEFAVPNRNASYLESSLRVSGELISWKPANDIPCRAAISSFGFSGTNGHIIVQEAPHPSRPVRVDRQFWITLSAKTSAALKRKAAELKHWLDSKGEDVSLLDLSYTLTVGRSALEERLAFSAWNINHVRAGLEQFLTSEDKGIRLWTGTSSVRDVKRPESRETGAAWVRGNLVDWGSLYVGLEPRRLHLPVYPFERERYWYDTFETPSLAYCAGYLISVGSINPLLGLRQELGSGEIIYQSQISCQREDWLADHRVFDKIVVPGALYLAMALAAQPEGCRLLRGVISRPLLLESEKEKRQLQLVLRPGSDGKPERRFELYSRALPSSENQSWMLHVEGNFAGLKAKVEKGLGESLSQLQERLPVRAVGDYYQALARAGIELRRRFQGLCALWSAAGEALGQVCMPDGVKDQAGPIHPVVLDGCLQVVGATLRIVDGTYVPFEWDELSIWGPVPVRFYSYARMRQTDRPSLAGERMTADLQLLDETGQLFGQIRGLVLQRANARSFSTSSEEGLDSWLYEIEWQERSRVEPSAEFWPEPEQLVERVEPLVPRIVQEGGEFQRPGLAEALEDLSEQYIYGAFQEMGWRPVLGETINAEGLCKSLNVVNTQSRCFGRLLEVLANRGLLVKQETSWQVRRVPELPKLQGQEEELLKYHPQGRIELSLLARCGKQLANVLRGQCDPLGLLFPAEGLRAEDLYRESPALRLSNRVVQETVVCALASLPPGRPLRVLEVGAGTAGTTNSVLSVLPAERSEYWYTDISAGFFDRARKQLNVFDFVHYQVLDIERPPSEQRIESGQFDLVIAANVLHATRDLGATLRHVLELLVPGGLLILVEAVRRQAWLDLTFGLLDGWWRFADSWREDYPLLEVPEWIQILGQSGFGSARSILPDADGSQAVIVARAGQTVRATAPRADSWWLIAADRQGVGEQLKERLGQRGQPCVLISSADVYEKRSEEHYQLPGQEKAAWERLLQECAEAGRSIGGAVHLWSLDAVGTAETTPETLRKDTQHACGSALALIQALVGGNVRLQNGLWLITQGALVVLAESLAVKGEKEETRTNQSLIVDHFSPGTVTGSLAQSPLWGLGKVVALEHPEFGCRRVDLELDADSASRLQQLEGLVAELLAPDREDETVWRGGRRWVPRLQRIGRMERPESLLENGPRFSETGVYLITGGLGGLGLEVAQWLLEKGVKRLVLNGRRPPSAEAGRTLERLRQQGAEVEVIVADVTKATEVKSLLRQTERDGRKLTGIFHLSGVLQDAALLNQSWPRFEEVLAPKMLGAWHLHQLTLEQPPELFILFSSITSVVGNPGQSNSAAANIFLDMLAHYRRARRLSANCINWGAWSRAGAAARQKNDLQIVGAGLNWMSPEEAFKAFERGLARRGCQMVIASIDWMQFRQSIDVDRLFFRKLVVTTRGQNQQITETQKGTSFLHQLQALPARERLGALIVYLQQEVVSALRLGALPDPATGFSELGMDSLMAVELRNRLQRELDGLADLPATLLFKYPNAAALAGYLADLLETKLQRNVRTIDSRGLLSEAVLDSGPPTTPNDIPLRLDGVSFEEAELLLLKELAELKEELR